jgi:hypothetical protein
VLDHPALNAAIEAAFHDGDGQVVALFNIDAKVFDAAGTPLQAYQNASLKSLNESSAPGEIMNAMGPYLSFNRMKNEEGRLLNFLGEVPEDKKKLN